MTFFIILMLVVSIIEIHAMSKKKQVREIVVFIVIALLTISLGYVYFSNPYRESITQRILSIL